MTIYNEIVIAAWAAFLIYWIVSSFSAKRTVSGGWRGLWFRAGFIVIFIAIEIFGTSFLPNLNELTFPTTDTAVYALGAALVVIGVAFAIWARYYLGRNWGMPMTERENPELVTSGPYVYVRHPIYTGAILALVGSVLTSERWWILVAIFAIGYFMYSATQEEKLMQQKFPDTYPAYKARTKMLIPFIF